MEIAFVKTGESHDRVHIRRVDGSEAAWRWGAGGPPHDLVHWVVEDELGIDRGFWGLVAGGADFGFVNASAHAGERESAELGDTTELMQAEAVVNSIQQGLAMDPRWSDLECLRWAATWCREARAELPAGLEIGRYGEVRTTAEDWVLRYRGLGAGEALHVTFPSHL
jgi:hypothetical protein